VEQLVKTPIIDKNGKQTHVWKKTDLSSGVQRSIPDVSVKSSLEEDLDAKLAKHFDIISFNGREFGVAPEGFSGAYCLTCFSPFRKEELNDEVFTCNTCHTKTFSDLTGTVIRHDALKFLDDQEVLNSSWFHITTKSDWLTEVTSVEKTPLIHLGTEEAAYDRLEQLKKNASSPKSKTSQTKDFYLYEVRLLPHASMSNQLVEDNNELAPEHVGEINQYAMNFSRSFQEQMLRDYDLYGTTRYLNSYEAIGSISLLTNPMHLELVNVIPHVVWLP